MDGRVASEVVPECRDYELAVTACFHRSFSIAEEPELIPHTMAERRMIQQRCRQNLERITLACR
jgi:hypothetical protein